MYNQVVCVGSDMALMINDLHILYYNMDAVRLTLFGCSHFQVLTLLQIKVDSGKVPICGCCFTNWAFCL